MNKNVEYSRHQRESLYIDEATSSNKTQWDHGLPRALVRDRPEIVMRDWRTRRDERGFEVRNFRFSELRTPNAQLRSCLSRASWFERLTLPRQVEGRAMVCGAGGFFQHPVRMSPS